MVIALHYLAHTRGDKKTMPKETILILDKDLHIQWTLKTSLENERYIVVSLNSIERVLRSFSEFEVSGFITEYWIGHLNSVEMLREIKNTYPWLYVMMLTDADIMENEYEEIINAGVDDFFLKPISTKKLLLHLRKGLKQRRTFLEKNRLEQELKRIIGTKETDNVNQAMSQAVLK